MKLDYLCIAICKALLCLGDIFLQSDSLKKKPNEKLHRGETFFSNIYLMGSITSNNSHLINVHSALITTYNSNINKHNWCKKKLDHKFGPHETTACAVN